MNGKDLWYRQLGFHNNPLSIKPAAFYDELLGCDNIVRKVNRAISTRKVVFVEGEYGNGKSTLLRRIINRFGGRGRVIYFSCNRIEKSLNIEKLLRGRYGLIGKLLNMKARGMILLLDEAHWLTKDDYARLVRYYRSGNFSSMVFVGKEFNQEIFPDGLKSVLEHIRLGYVSEEDAVRIIRKRVGNLPILGDDVIRSIFAKSGYNVRLLLKNCELLCRHAFERDEDSVTVAMVDEMLSEIKEEIKTEDIKEEVKAAEIEEEKVKEEAQVETEVPIERKIEEEKPAEALAAAPEEEKTAEVELVNEEKPREELAVEQKKALNTEELYY